MKMSYFCSIEMSAFSVLKNYFFSLKRKGVSFDTRKDNRDEQERDKESWDYGISKEERDNAKESGAIA